VKANNKGASPEMIDLVKAEVAIKIFYILSPEKRLAPN